MPIPRSPNHVLAVRHINLMARSAARVTAVRRQMSYDEGLISRSREVIRQSPDLIAKVDRVLEKGGRIAD